MKHTYLKYVLGVAVQMAALCSCIESTDMWADAPQHVDAESAGVVEVMLSLPSLPVATRTSIDKDYGDDEGSTLVPVWDVGDSFGLIVRSAEGNDVDYHLVDDTELKEPYEFTHTDNVHDLSGNIFVGRMPRMPLDGPAEGDESSEPVEPALYNYYAVYPYGAVREVSGSEVRCRIPSVQSGRYDDGADIMVASAQGARLNQQHLNPLNFKFQHLTHALKITVPAGRDHFGHGVTRMTIEFEKPVAGEAVLSLTDIDVNDPKPEFNTDGLDARTITVNFDKPLFEGDTFWVFIAPVDLTGTTVRFSAYNDAEGRLALPVDAADSADNPAGFKDMKAQHITPVNMTLNKDVGYRATWFDYEILDETSRLGEELESLNLTLPEGLTTGDGDGGTVKLTEKINLMGNTYRIIFRADDFDAYMASAGTLDFLPIYESEQAILPPYATDLDKFVVADGGYLHNNVRTIDCVPYLFEEDFSGAADNSFDDNYATSSTGNRDGHALDGLSGWTGARVGTSAGISARLAPRYESVLAGATYPSRLDSAPLQNLKSSASVSITFDYGMDAQYGGIGGAVRQQNIELGYVTDPNIYGGGDRTGTFVDSFNMKEQGASWTSLPYLKSYTIQEATNSTRLTWRASTETPGGASNCTCWLYIDNIKVSIVKE